MKNIDSQILGKYKDLGKSFVEKLLLEGNLSHTGSFIPFPNHFDFYGREKEEDILLIVRTHWIAYLQDILIALATVVLSLVLLLLSYKNPLLGTPVLYLGILVSAIVISINILIVALLKWYYTVSVITNKRVVVITMKSAFSHSYAEAPLEKIEDITHKNIGLIENIFDVGNIDIDTAGHEIDFRLYLIPRPRDVQDTLNDLLDMKQKEGVNE